MLPQTLTSSEIQTNFYVLFRKWSETPENPSIQIEFAAYHLLFRERYPKIYNDPKWFAVYGVNLNGLVWRQASIWVGDVHIEN